MTRLKVLSAVSISGSRSGPRMFRSMARVPVTPRPNRERCVIWPSVPGSLNAASLRIGIRSLTRAGSWAAAPRMVRPRKVTKKKRFNLGRPWASGSGPETSASSGNTSFS